MKPSVYIESSVVSYLTARISRNLIVAAHQQITNDWWETALPHYNAFVSPIVLEEVSKGDRHATQLRLEEINSKKGIRTPIICTPEELMEV